MGDYLEGNQVGKQVSLLPNGEVKINNIGINDLRDNLRDDSNDSNDSNN